MPKKEIFVEWAEEDDESRTKRSQGASRQGRQDAPRRLPDDLADLPPPSTRLGSETDVPGELPMPDLGSVDGLKASADELRSSASSLRDMRAREDELVTRLQGFADALAAAIEDGASRLREAHAGLERERATLSKVRHEMLDEQGKLERLRDDLSNGQQMLLSQQAEVATLQAQLAEERTGLDRDWEQFESEKKAFGEREAELTSQRSALEVERAAVGGDKGSLDSERDRLRQQAQALKELKARMDSDRVKLDEERKSFEQERERFRQREKELEDDFLDKAPDQKEDFVLEPAEQPAKPKEPPAKEAPAPPPAAPEAQGKAAPPPKGTKTGYYREIPCPRCNATIVVKTPNRPVKIACSKCGKSGVLKK